MNNGPTVKKGKTMRANALSANAFLRAPDRSSEIVTPSRLYLASGDTARDSRGAPHLTPRQLEVLALLCQGLPNKLICRQLKISAGTVKAHISSILRELGVASRLQAVVEAGRRGLLDTNDEDPGQLRSVERAHVRDTGAISFAERAAANHASHRQSGE
jgi:DNA-binding CsgD family transcriptional regulator